MVKRATSTALLVAAALASAGTVLTYTGTQAEPASAEPARYEASSTPSTTTAVSEPTPTPTPAAEPAPQSNAELQASPQELPPVGPPTITLHPTTGIDSQAAIDTGNLITWWLNPLILAGHDYAGWDYIDDLAIGTRIHVATGPGAGVYEVFGSYDLPGKDHYLSEIPHADLILQTCTDWGLGFSLATRIA